MLEAEAFDQNHHADSEKMKPEIVTLELILTFAFGSLCLHFSKICHLPFL